MKNHRPVSRHKLTLTALLAVATFAAPPAPAQIEPFYGNADTPVAEGRIRVAPASFGTDVVGGIFVPYVEGPAAFTATVSTQNAASFRESGNPLFPLFNGQTRIKLQTRKLTTAQIVKGELSRQGITNPRGYRLLWRARADNMAAAFKEGEGLQVGRKGFAQRYNADAFLRMEFTGGGIPVEGQSVLESGSYLIASGGNPLQITRWQGRRSGFIWSNVGVEEALSNPRLDLDGLVRIKRTLKVNRSPNFGEDFVNYPFETGTVSGRVGGYANRP